MNEEPEEPEPEQEEYDPPESADGETVTVGFDPSFELQ